LPPEHLVRQGPPQHARPGVTAPGAREKLPQRMRRREGLRLVTEQTAPDTGHHGRCTARPLMTAGSDDTQVDVRPAVQAPNRVQVTSSSTRRVNADLVQPSRALQPVIVSATEVYATPPGPQPRPPPTGTNASSLPWMCMTGTGRAGAHETAIFVPATGPIARIRSAAVAREPVTQDGTVRHAGRVDPAAVDAGLPFEVVDQGPHEPDVVNVVGHGVAAASTAVPSADSELRIGDTVRRHGDEPSGVGRLGDAGAALHLLAAAESAVEEQHDRRRGVGIV